MTVNDLGVSLNTMNRRITIVALALSLLFSVALNVYLYYNSHIQKTESVVGTYITGDDKDYFEYLVLDENHEYMKYTQKNGLIEKGSYTQEKEYILCKPLEDTDEYRIVYQEGFVVAYEDNSLVIYRKDSDVPTYINITP